MVGILGWAVEARAQDSATDRAALVALYNATGGTNWTGNTNWLSNRPLSMWHGVTVHNGRVTELSLPGNQLTGSIPTQLGNLTSLEVLWLPNNQLTGDIPSRLGNLASLEGLGLTDNQLTGDIPTQLGNLANLRGLFLSDNQLTGDIPTQLGNLSNLEWLWLNHNQLTGDIPSQLGNLASLERLRLNHNQLTGSIPSQLGNLVSLNELSLSRNQLTGDIPSQLGNLSNLEWLWLATNQLTGDIPSQLGNLSNLLSLELHLNQLTGGIPPELGNLSNLEWLRLNHNQLTGSIPAELGNLSSLVGLALLNNQLTGDIPSQLGNLSSLEWLWLSDNQLTGSIPTELGNLSSLNLLWLHNNQLTGDIPTSFTRLGALKYFRFYLNPGLCGQDAAAIRSWLDGVNDVQGPDCSPAVQLSANPSQLSESAGATPVTVTAERAAVSSDTRVTLRVGGSAGADVDYELGGTLSLTIPANGTSGTTVLTVTPLVDALAEKDENIIIEAVVENKTEGSVTLPLVDAALPCAARDRMALEALYNATGGPNWANNTNWLSDKPLSEWRGVTIDSNGCVTGLGLRNNQLTGAIPAELGNLSSLEGLRLHTNQLTGGIPSELGNLSQLQTVWLNNNQLTGNIPSELGTLASLEELRLGNNQLTGSIPAQLGNLSSLGFLYLHNNQLTGTLPTSFTELDALERFHFNLNPGLCAQDAAAIRSWLDSVNEVQGPDCSPAVRLSVNPSQLSEDAGATPVTVTAERTAVSSDTRVTLRVGGSAGRNRDYTLGGTLRLTIPADGTSGTTTLTVTPLAEKDENIILEAVVGRKTEGSAILTLARACAARDRAALEAFYNATGGSNWADNTNWLSDKPLSEWQGVTIDSNGCVTRLELREYGLTGTLPSELGSLAKLEGLYLSDNRLTGAIPSQLGNLANLEGLSLAVNQLTGTIPSQLGNLAKLEGLSLADNQLTGAIPSQLGNLANLEGLYLYDNRLTGAIPSQLGNLAGLEWLWLHNNQLTGSIPTQLGNLASLQDLRLSTNQLTGTLPTSFTRLGALEGFYFYLNPGLCAQDDAAIRSWLAGVNVQGPDCSPAVRLSVNPSQLSENAGATPVTVTAERTAVSSDTRVDLRLGGSAGRNLDYTLGGALRLTIPANSTSGTTTLTVTPLADALADKDENIILEAVVGRKTEGSAILTLARACAARDQATLAALYNGTGGETWTKETNWDPRRPMPLSEWFGVTTDSNGCVTGLDLSENGLTGTLPSELGNLASLQELDLSGNQLTGAIPPDLGKLASLERLDLNSTQLTGAIPTQLGNLASLEHLRLNHNQLTGSIPAQLGNLANLEWLSLSGNPLTGAIPPELGNLASLERLELFRNQLTGSIPTQLGNLASLERLFLHNNQLTGALPAQLGNLANLEWLLLDRNQLTGTLPSELGSLSNLKHLRLSTNQLTGTLPTSFTRLGALEGFYFYLNPGLCAQDDAAVRTWLDGVDDVRGPDCSPAVRLSVNPSRLWEGAGATSVTVTATRTAISSDTRLDLRVGGSAGADLDYTLGGALRLTIPANGTSGTTTLTITPLADALAEKDENIILEAVVGNKIEDSVALPLVDAARACTARDQVALEAFYHVTGGPNWWDSTNWLSDKPLPEWRGVTVDSNGCVTGLDLSENGLTGAFPSELANLANLEHLRLNDNRLTGTIPSELANLANLEGLYLSDNQLTGGIPTQLTNLASLEWLGLAYNRLTGGIPTALANLASLQTLGLSGNRLTGTIPSELANLANLEGLYLSDNLLMGSIPSELGRLADLEALYLSDNQLTGEIPAQLGNLASLQVLYLGYNQLTGSIPTQLGNLASLQTLGLRSNQLTGSIPAELGNLASLEHLVLNHNQLTGEIPAQLGNLASLEGLYLRNNQLTGTLPTELGNLANLEGLYLDNNQLTGTLPTSFTRLGALRRFAFSLNPGLCAQDDAAIRTWLDGVNEVRGPDCSPAVRLSVNPSQLSEDAGATLVTVTAERTAVGSYTRVYLRVGGSAGRNLDYTLDGSLSFVIPANSTSGTTTLTVTPLADALAEDENIILQAVVGNKTEGAVTLPLADAAEPIAGIGCVAGDRAALEAFYHLTGGPNWADNTNWLSDKPLSEWRGVTVDSNGCVTGLDLTDNQLTGSVPTAPGNLASLQTLGLSDNQLTGSIPSELGNLASLEALYLSGNQLTGDIPTELGNLANLRELSLSGNQLTGDIPVELSRLASLEALYLSGNQLTGDIPAQLGNLAKLERLYLNNNQLTGDIPAQLGNLAKLERLYLNNNQLTGDIPAQLGNLASLQDLTLSGNQLTGGIPVELGDLTRLERLYLDDNQLTGTLPTSLTRLGALRRFNFSLNPGLCAQDDAAIRSWLDGVNEVRGPDCSSAVRLAVNPSQLSEGAGATPVTVTAERTAVGSQTRVDLRVGGSAGRNLDYTLDGSLSFVIPANSTSGTTTLTVTPLADALAENEDIILQAVVGNKTEGSVTLPLADAAEPIAGIGCAAGDRAALEAFYHLTGGPNWADNTNWLSDKPLSEWRGVTVDSNGCVTGLDLTDNQLTESIPTALGNLASLQTLGLSDNLLTGSIPPELGRLASLEALNLSGNQLTGAIPTALGNLANLRELSLSSSQLTGSIPVELSRLADLEGLYLSGNRLTGDLPAQLGNLASLRFLSLSGNQLTGSIPVELSRLADLEGLYLSGNRLTGTLPSQLGNLTSLQELTLSGNQLTGGIPVELGDLASLEGLYLDDNQLTGTLPTSFTRLGALRLFHFSLNPGLCAQDDAAIRSWLDGVNEVRGPDCSPAVRLSANPSQLSEGAGATPVTVTAERTAVGIHTRVDLRVGGSAGRNLDYTLSGNLHLTIPANSTSGTTTLTVTPLADALAEDEDIILEAVVGNKTEGAVTLPLADAAEPIARIGCAARDRAALEAFYHLTGGPNWADNTNWLSDKPLSEWRGVTVDSNGCVTGLDLPENGLTGDIPSELSDLSSLEMLYLSGNQLAGTLPTSFTRLRALESFYFDQNSGLCAPDDAAIRTWLDGIDNVRGPECALSSLSSLFVPVILSASGRNNAFFTSEMTLTNRGSQPATLGYTYRAHAGGGSGSASETLPPGRQKVVPNAIDHLRTLGVPIPSSGNRIGTLRVEVSGSEVGVTVRTTTRVADGRAGLAYPAVAGDAGFEEEAVYLCGLRQNARDRSNLAVQNMGTSAEGNAILRITVFSGDPEAPGSRVLPEVTLAPGGFRQLNGILATAGFAQGYVKVERVGGEAPFYAYGVINDQVNSDGSFVFPVAAGSLAGVRGLTLPVLIEHPNFTSELILTNFSDTAKELNLHFVAEAIATPDNATANFGVPVPAGAQVIIPDVVQAMREAEAEGIGPRGRTIAGAAFFEAAQGDLSGVVIGARTGSRGGGGLYSVFYNAVPYGSAFDRTAWIDALQQNRENRSNLALVNTGEADASDSVFQLEIYNGETGRLVNTVTGIRVPARGWHQINGILGSYAPGTPQGYVRVRKTAGNNPFLAYGVINDGGTPGQRSDDGAYLPATGEQP